MSDPFAPSSCRDCGTELPYRVHRAREFLYDGYRMDPSSLVEKVEEGIRGRSRRDAHRADLDARYPTVRPLGPISDKEIGEEAVSSWLYDGFEPEDLTAAIAHYGDLGHPDGSECERIEAAKWCHARDAVLAKGTTEEWSRSLCNLEADHDGPHSFERETANA